jgi:serine/threonine-protein kinase HipA
MTRIRAMAEPRNNRAMVLGVWLEPSPRRSTRVGTLVRDATNAVRFNVDEAYIALGNNRPILSSAWNQPGDEDKTLARLRNPYDKMASGGLLPFWFANLLPEGALRDVVEQQLGTGRHDDFDVIARLGRDLPGAVVVRDETDSSRDADARELLEVALNTAERTPPIRFSLAGVQLKLSMRAAKDKLTIPAKDQVGDIIAKLPNARYPFMLELEFTAMKLAAAAGVETAGVRLVPNSAVIDLPMAWQRYGEHVLAVDRFDRFAGAEGVERRHTEDFAQIIGAVAERKYTMSNEETNMKLVSRFAQDGSGGVLEAVRRIVTNVLLGNMDAHLKNWSMMYEGREARLSRAYDIFPSYVYDQDPHMALAFGGTKQAARITLRKFERAADYVDMDPRALVNEAKETVERAADRWPALIREMPAPVQYVKVLRERWETLALTTDIPNAFETAHRLAAKP